MRRFLALMIAFVLGAGCAATAPTYSTLEGRRSIVDAVHASLTQRDCGSAYLAVQPWYNSSYSDNAARHLMAAVHGCYAGVDVMTLLLTMAAQPSTAAGNGFWRFLARTFPSTTAPSDRILENAFLGIDAAQAFVNPGVVLNPIYTVGVGGFNPRSLVPADRASDANAYLTYLGMAAIGALENRYGAPNPTTFAPTVALPGATAATATGVTCQIAAAAINYMDGIHSIATTVTGPSGALFRTLDTNFTSLIATACDQGCTGAAPGFGVASGCALASCAGCPTALRNSAAACTGVVTDQNSCAAAGVVNFLNSSPAGWN